MAEGVEDHGHPAGGLAVLRTSIKLRASGHDPLTRASTSWTVRCRLIAAPRSARDASS